MINQEKGSTPGQRLREVRNYFNKTQMQFGQELGSDQTYVSRMETDREPIGDDMLYRMEKEFSISRTFIQEGQEPMVIPGSGQWATEQVKPRDFTQQTKNGESKTTGGGNLLVVAARDRGQFLKLGMDASLTRVAFPFVVGDAVAFEMVSTQMIPLFPPSSYVVAVPLDSPTYMLKSEPYIVAMKDELCVGFFAGEQDGKIQLTNSAGDVQYLPVNELQSAYYIELKIVKP